MRNTSLLTFMAFPLNVIFAFVWVFLFVWLYKCHKESLFVRFMLSMRATIAAMLLAVAGTLGVAFIPHFTTSWPFILILLFVQSVLLLVILRGCRRKGKIRWRFILNHVGLWLALFAGFWGAADNETLRVPVYRNMETREAYYEDGRVTYLDYSLRLNDFKVEYFSNGAPSHYEAQVAVGSESAVITVNNPYEYSFAEHIYLTGYDVSKGSDTQYCILQIVREPWGGLVYAGVIMMLLGALLLFVKGPKKREDGNVE